MPVFARLRERRIVQILLSYLAVGWGLLEVADQLADRGVLPEVVYFALLVWFAAGIPAALVIGWNHGEKGAQRPPRGEVVVLLGLLLAATLGSGAVVRNDVAARRARAAAEHPADLRSVAVLYLEDRTGDPELGYLADALTEDLTGALRSVRELDVLSRHATAPFRGTGSAPDSIAAALEVGTLVGGSVDRRRDRIEVTLELIDGLSGAVVQRTRIARPSTDVLAVRDEVVEEAATLLREWIGRELRLRRSAQRTGVRQAWVLLQRAEKLRKEAEEQVRSGDPAAGEALFLRAGDLLQEAAALDPAWPDPLVHLTAITYRRSRIAGAAGNMPTTFARIDEGLAHAGQALALSPDEPRALELRGTLRYFRWLLTQNTGDPDERRLLLADARDDLERAVALDPSLATAFSTLSHLLYNEDLTSAVLAARQAYDADAYLEAAGDVLWRLFYGYFDLANFTQSWRWCREGARRFPDDYRFAYCELRLMASPGIEPDERRARELADRIPTMAPPQRRGFEAPRAVYALGGVYGRLHQADSARAIIMRARSMVKPEADPNRDLLWFEAHMWVLANAPDQAIDALHRAIVDNPALGFRRGAAVTWLYRHLQAHPAFERLYTR